MELPYEVINFIPPQPITLQEYQRLKTILNNNPDINIAPPLDFYDLFPEQIIAFGCGIIGAILISLEAGFISVVGIFLLFYAFVGFILFLRSLDTPATFINNRLSYYSKLKQDILLSNNYAEFKDYNRNTNLNANYDFWKSTFNLKQFTNQKSTTAVDNLLILAVILLLAASIINWENGYYLFLKITISFIAGIYLFIYLKLIQNGFSFWNIVFLLVFIIFNPIIPIYFEKETWVVIDVISASFIALRYYQLSRINHYA